MESHRLERSQIFLSKKKNAAEQAKTKALEMKDFYRKKFLSATQTSTAGVLTQYMRILTQLIVMLTYNETSHKNLPSHARSSDNKLKLLYALPKALPYLYHALPHFRDPVLSHKI